TIFHPQGGGQKADCGLIGNSRVHHVAHHAGGVDHYVDSLNGLVVGQLVSLRVEPIQRELHSAWHTAGHLVAAVVEHLYPGLIAVAGHQWPGEGRVEFQTKAETVVPDASRINNQLADDINAGLMVHMSVMENEIRTIQIGDYPKVPCGGTHLKSLEKFKQVIVTSIKKKCDKVRVSFYVDI
ncbi:hypothetical protein, partial [Aeromonas finlandensis]|uniref:hypothetical protein n=1 Tax=Aeromonas finlandensis TaxID=1543375 RepID=UPI00051AC1AD